MPRNLHDLPRLRDSLSYLYIEHAVVQRRQHAIEYIRKDKGRVMIPVAGLSVLMLGPGTRITHAAVRILAEHGCTVLWVGEDTTRFYAQGVGETRHAYRLLKQAELATDPQKRLRVVRRMYEMRFGEPLDPSWTLEQIRGREGNRVRSAYRAAAKQYGVQWQGRRYDFGSWKRTDPINRALSAANALLNGLCHAAILAGGYSPALGFIHTGKQLSFVYDIADLYKVEITVPAAFEVVAESTEKVESRVRQRCRERFREAKLLQRILPDIDRLLGLKKAPPHFELDYDANAALPAPWWEPESDLASGEGQDGGDDSGTRAA